MRSRWFEKRQAPPPALAGDEPDRRVPVTAVDAPAARLRCPLCGKQFSAGEAAACSGCALATRCGLVMCPNCAYEFAV